jgi:hypothetical protein
MGSRAAISLPPPAPFSPEGATTGGLGMLHEFTPQEVFLVVFSGVVIISYLVNRAHCYDLKRNNHEAH